LEIGPQTALSMVFAGLAMAQRQARPEPRRPVLRRIFGCGALVAALAALLGLPWPGPVMAPLALLLVAFALLIETEEGHTNPSLSFWLAVGVLAMTLTTISSDIFPLYEGSVTRYPSVSLLADLGLFTVGVALLLAESDRDIVRVFAGDNMVSRHARRLVPSSCSRHPALGSFRMLLVPKRTFRTRTSSSPASPSSTSSCCSSCWGPWPGPPEPWTAAG